MTYSNPQSSKLGLLDDDLKMEGKLIRLCADLEQKILTPIADAPFQWHVLRADTTTSAVLSDDWRNWEKFGPHSVWAKKQGHTWFAAEVEVPEAAAGQTLVLLHHLRKGGGEHGEGITGGHAFLGIVDAASVCFFLSISGLFLALTVVALERRRWS